MFRNAILAVAAVAVIGATLFQAGPADAACRNWGHGCITTSDGAGYTDDRSWVTRYMEHVRERRVLAEQKVRVPKNQGWSW
jgi:hypothetical protein